jgi:hypothetical protein
MSGAALFLRFSCCRISTSLKNSRRPCAQQFARVMGFSPPPLTEQVIEAGELVDLEDTAVAGQMRSGMFALAVARVVAQRHRRRRAAERAIVPHIIPDPRHLGLVLGEKRNSGVVGMKAVCGKPVGFQKQEQGLHRHAYRADLVSQRREAQGDTLPLEAIALTVQGLMQAVLLEGEVRQEVRPEHSARGYVERRRGLADPLALTARDLLPNRLDHLVPGRHPLERFGDVCGQMAQIVRTATGAGVGRGDHDLFAWQVSREVAARGPLAGKGSDCCGLCCRDLPQEFGFAGVRLEFLERQLQLVE